MCRFDRVCYSLYMPPIKETRAGNPSPNAINGTSGARLTERRCCAGVTLTAMLLAAAFLMLGFERNSLVSPSNFYQRISGYHLTRPYSDRLIGGLYQDHQDEFVVVPPTTPPHLQWNEAGQTRRGVRLHVVAVLTWYPRRNLARGRNRTGSHK